MTLTELARRLGISVVGLGYSVERGEMIALETRYQLIERVFKNFKGVPSSHNSMDAATATANKEGNSGRWTGVSSL
jgi:hypothetical protein